MEYYVVIQEGGYMEEKEIDVVTHEVDVSSTLPTLFQFL